jgi:DNA-binding Lrp family transcriptional regulator
VKELPQSQEDRERDYRAIYEVFHENPRAFKKEIANLLHIRPSSANNRIRKAIELGYMSKSQIRLRSFANLMEYTYFLNCKNPSEFFSEFVDNEKIVYHALMSSCANMWVVSREELDLDCRKVVGGPRSDYLISYAPNHSWETATQKMWKKVGDFNPKDYEPQGFIKSHWNETIEWDSEYEALFREFNYDLMKPIDPIIKKYLISWGKVDKWMKNLSKYCTIITGYYPGGISSYDPYLFMLETDYEDFIVNLFSELPTSSLFFKVSNKLFLLAYVKREYMRFLNSQIHIGELQIPSMLTKLIHKDVIRSESHGIVECYWQKSIHPGIPP